MADFFTLAFIHYYFVLFLLVHWSFVHKTAQMACSNAIKKLSYDTNYMHY